MLRILVAVDDDGMKDNVAKIAADLALATHAKLTICHVMSTSKFDLFKTRKKQPKQSPSFSFSAAEEDAKQVARTIAKTLSDLDLDIGTIGLVGHPAEEIVRLSKQLKSDLIVIGFEALHGWNRIKTLGSVSRAVMENANCPVMIVPLNQVDTSPS